MAKLDLGYKTVELYFPGQLLELDIPGENHKEYEVVRNTIIWEEGGEPTQMLTLGRINDEGDRLDETDVVVNADLYDIVEI